MRKIVVLLTTFLILLSISGRTLASGGLAPVPGPYGSPDDGPATTILGYILTCSSLTVTGQTGSAHVVIYIAPDTISSTSVNVAASNGAYQTTVNFGPVDSGTTIVIETWGETNTGTGANTPDWDGHGWSLVASQACPASWGSLALPNQGGVTWFNPGDGRIDGQPGDRIAVWCNTSATPPNIVVYGVGDNATNGSHGFWLATFNNADLLKAGKTGITKNAGAGNGTISAMQDGNGNFWVAWNGGLFNATGQGDFAKRFSCQF